MDEIQQALIDAGLSSTEAQVYKIVLIEGPIGVGKIAKLSNVYRANAYQAVERLKNKGYVSESQGKRSKVFEALSPHHLIEDLSKKKKSLQEIMPKLNELRRTRERTESMRVIEGEQGWRNLLNEFIESGKERVVYGIPLESQQLGEFFIEYHKKRAKKKIWLKHLFNYDARERIRVTNKLPYTQSKYLPKELDQPVSTSICGNTIAVTVYERKAILTYVIESEPIAKAYKKYFKFLWTLGKK
ncbi:MAG: Transcriptional regulator TrmB [Parcubacteria group bacterium GW2011_GWA2_31_28]|nr:MAG: Transcriptional regulator TrmB [Parcubacteria group bacterium GW2011_GWA2_31_28]